MIRMKKLEEHTRRASGYRKEQPSDLKVIFDFSFGLQGIDTSPTEDLSGTVSIQVHSRDTKVSDIGKQTFAPPEINKVLVDLDSMFRREPRFKGVFPDRTDPYDSWGFEFIRTRAYPEHDIEGLVKRAEECIKRAWRSAEVTTKRQRYGRNSYHIVIRVSGPAGE